MKATLYRHLKTKGVYRIVLRGVLEADETKMIAYQPLEGGAVWIRPEKEFFDGRFVAFEVTVGEGHG